MVLKSSLLIIYNRLGGNAGLAAAYAGRKLGLPVTVIVPETTPQIMINKIKEEEATVEIVGKVIDDVLLKWESILSGK